MSDRTNAPPWASLDPELGGVLSPLLPSLVDEVMQGVRDHVPAYATRLEGRFGEQIRGGVERALAAFVELVRSGPRAKLPSREVYVALGRGEARAGRPLDALLGAYRGGAQIAWRRMGEAADRAGADATTLIRLAEAIFAFIDDLSAASAEGHAEAALELAGERRERRRQLVHLLLRDPPLDTDELLRAASAAGWRVPATVAAVSFEHPRPERLAARLPPDALLATEDPRGAGAGSGVAGLAMIADPEAPGRPEQLRRAFEDDDVRAALGPTVPVQRAAVSAERATRALVLCRPGGDLIAAQDHTLDLILLADPALARELSVGRLAPLGALAPNAAARAEATLRTWLEHHGDARATAAALHVHVQTVRYRVGRLHELFGDALDTAQGRLELAVALRARAILPPGRDHAG